jgi:hypothetical protein
MLIRGPPFGLKTPFPTVFSLLRWIARNESRTEEAARYVTYLDAGWWKHQPERGQGFATQAKQAGGGLFAELPWLYGR